MVTQKIVEVSEKPQPKFKRYPTRTIEDDPLGAFLHIPYGVLPIEDIREYIYGSMDENSPRNFRNVWASDLVDENFTLKPRYKAPDDKKLDVCEWFPNFFYDNKWIKMSLSRIHDQFVWNDMLHMITKEVMR